MPCQKEENERSEVKSTNPLPGAMAGSRYGYLFGLVLIIIVLVFSFFLKEDKISEK